MPTRFFDGLRTSSYDGALEAGTAVRLASLLRYATGVVPLDVYQVEFGKVGTPSTLDRGPHRRAHQGDRGADAADRRDQAPGQDRHRRHLAIRRDAAAGSARAGAPRGRARRATASPTVRCARWSPSTRRSTPSSGGSRYRIDGDPARPATTIEVVDAGGIARDIPSRTADEPDPARHQAPRRERARGHGGAGPRRRPHARDRARDQGEPDDRAHAAARALPRAARRPTSPGGCSRATATATKPSPTRSPRSSRSMRDDVLGTIDLVDLLTEPGRPTRRPLEVQRRSV